MRLRLIAPADLSPEQRPVYEDMRTGIEKNFQGFSLSLTAANEAEADRKFAALSNRGQVTMPLGKTFFSPRFGMLVDRFGISWMVIVPAEANALAA